MLIAKTLNQERLLLKRRIMMKVKNVIAILSLAFMLLLCLSCVSASDDIDDADAQLEASDSDDCVIGESAGDEVLGDESAKSSETASGAEFADNGNIDPIVLCGQGFVQKKSQYLKVRVYSFDDNFKKVFHKNVKLTVKVKIGKKTKTYNLKTNSKGQATVLNVKNLKAGTYKVRITTPNSKYKINEKDRFNVYGKAKKKITLKLKKNEYGLENEKKLKIGDTIHIFYEPKNAQYPKGFYAKSYPTKNPLDGNPRTMVIKAKFFFKNKKTGKVISKTSKLTPDKFHGWKYIHVKPIKGYAPVKAKVWYLTR